MMSRKVKTDVKLVTNSSFSDLHTDKAATVCVFKVRKEFVGVSKLRIFNEIFGKRCELLDLVVDRREKIGSIGWR